MPSIEPLRVFMCHASSDKADVRKLYERLVAHGIDAWLDEKKLLAGQEWQSEISMAVRKSDAVVVCLSPVSVTKSGFVQKEIRFALDAADEKPEGTIYVIPARLRECDVPERLGKYHWVNLFEPNGYEQLLAALRECASALAKAPVSPAAPPGQPTQSPAQSTTAQSTASPPISSQPAASPLSDWSDFKTAIVFCILFAANFCFDKAIEWTDLKPNLLWFVLVHVGFFAGLLITIRAISKTTKWGSTPIKIGLTAITSVLVAVYFFVVALPHYQRVENLLEPGDELTPKIEALKSWPSHWSGYSKGETMLIIGNVAVSTSEQEFVVLRLYDRDLLKITRVKERIAVTAYAFDRNDNILVAIETNVFTVNSNTTFRHHRPDAHTLIVEDNQMNTVLSVKYLNPNTIKLSGTFGAGGRYPVVIDDNLIRFGPLLIHGGLVFHGKGTPIFEWPGRFPGSRSIAKMDEIIPGASEGRFVANRDVMNILVPDIRGNEFSVFQCSKASHPGTNRFFVSYQLMRPAERADPK